MRERERPQDRLGSLRELDRDPAPIARRAAPAHEAVRGEAVDEPDGAVVAQRQTLGELPDAHSLLAPVTLDREQGLMLLRSEPRALRSLRAEGEKAAQQEAELREQLVVGLGKRGCPARR